METENLIPAMQEMMDRMSRMQAELDNLKQRTQALPQPIQPVSTPTTITSTRRNTLKRLGLALLGGVATAGALGEATAVKAKVSANPQGTLANRAGMLVVPPGGAAPTGTPPGGNTTYGLIASGDTTSLNLSNIYFSGNAGVYGSSSDFGVYGNGNIGVIARGSVTGVYGDGGSIGVFATSSDTGILSTSSNVGVAGFGNRVSGIFGGYSGSLKTSASVGVIGNAGSDLNLDGFGANINTGIYGTAGGNSTNFAGYFAGNVVVTGSVSKAGGSFKIDHPLDPTNKYLYHSFVESPDMMNIYNGLVILNGQGEATVEMPSWFEALNSDYRYGLTSIGAASPNLHIAQEMEQRKFKIGGGLAGQKVSWQVTGIRQDAWAKANRIPVEEDKTEEAKGKYLHPEVFGKSEGFRSM